MFNGAILTSGDGDECLESTHVRIGSPVDRCMTPFRRLLHLHVVTSLHHVYIRCLTRHVHIAVESRVCSDRLWFALELSLKSPLLISQHSIVRLEFDHAICMHDGWVQLSTLRGRGCRDAFTAARLG